MNETVVTQSSLINSTVINDYLSSNDGPLPYYPLDSFCVDYIQLYDNFTNLNAWDICPVTGDMINFLNLTTSKSLPKYFLAYCTLGAPQDDGCPYGWCPNSDIAASLTRIVNYVITSLVTVIVYYNPEGLAESFWSQLLTVYSILITSIISVAGSNLTRIHAVIATGLVASPLTIYIFIYAIRSIWGGGHRMHTVLGKGHIFARFLVILACGTWIALILYTLSPSTTASNSDSGASGRRGNLVDCTVADIRAKQAGESDEGEVNEADVVTDATLLFVENLKYLNATIAEIFRILATNAFELLRVVPEGMKVSLDGKASFPVYVPSLLSIAWLVISVEAFSSFIF
ncbi:hypothetical protein M422DRAFT_776992 [Sphaerobolus stellatus SS14]|nr:hypothetical protein M422DRAFT_776992 [Sphaerobolus stellatus SS14]